MDGLFARFWSTLHEVIKHKKLFHHISVIMLHIAYSLWTSGPIIVCTGLSLKPELAFNFLSYYFAYKSVHTPEQHCLWTPVHLLSEILIQTLIFSHLDVF